MGTVRFRIVHLGLWRSGITKGALYSLQVRKRFIGIPYWSTIAEGEYYTFLEEQKVKYLKIMRSNNE